MICHHCDADKHVRCQGEMVVEDKVIPCECTCNFEGEEYDDDEDEDDPWGEDDPWDDDSDDIA